MASHGRPHSGIHVAPGREVPRWHRDDRGRRRLHLRRRAHHVAVIAWLCAKPPISRHDRKGRSNRTIRSSLDHQTAGSLDRTKARRLGCADRQQARVPRRQGLGRMGTSTHRHRPLQGKRIQERPIDPARGARSVLGRTATGRVGEVPDRARDRCPHGRPVGRRLRPDHRGARPTSSTPSTATRTSRSSAAQS